VGFGISKVGHKILFDNNYIIEYFRVGNPSADSRELKHLPNLLYNWWYLPGGMYGGLSKFQPTCIRIVRG